VSGRRNRGAAEELRGSWLLFKIQRAFFEGVNVTYHQDRDETEHTPEDDAAFFDGVSIYDRPRIHEHDLDVEQDKKHCHDVELDAEAW
jgi:hypothetical protein